MKNIYKQKREQGFTIIEVMIVLAIAAVILLIVLLAVPALQRNSRNTQRANDAAQLASAVNSCLANQNGVVANCASVGTNAVDIDVTKLGQLTTPPTQVNGGTGTITKAEWMFQYKCVGNTPTAGASAKSVVIAFQVETTNSAAPGQRCVEA